MVVGSKQWIWTDSGFADGRKRTLTKQSKHMFQRERHKKRESFDLDRPRCTTTCCYVTIGLNESNISVKRGRLCFGIVILFGI